MALDIKDGLGVDRTLKTTLDGSDLVPHHNVDNLPADPSTATLQATEISALASILAKILLAPSTEAKQDAIITALGLLGTQTTSAAILAKLITAPATEAKQDAQVTALGSLATQTTSAAILAKLIVAPATEAKQDIQITSLSGLATQTTVASILAKIISAPATEAKQDTQVTALGTLATQTTLAAVLAKIITAPATEAKQDTQITSLGTLATQTTAAAILAKIIAAPSTEAKQDTGNTSLASILASLLPTLSNFRSLTTNSTAQSIKASAGELWGFNIINLDVVDIYVKFYNIASGSVNPASDVPIFTLFIPAAGVVYQEPATRLYVHSTAISVRTVTGPLDTNTAVATTAPIIELKYS